MLVNQKILSVPPYISTSWKNIISLHLEERHDRFLLIILLKNNTKVEVPGLNKDDIDRIFQYHARAIESETELENINLKDSGISSFGIPFKGGLDQLEFIGSAMQHNPNQTNSPSLPPEIISKIAHIVKVLGISDSEHLPKPEPHCNCFHCQIAKALQTSTGINEENLDPEVSDEELRFKDWEIKQTGNNLYSVTNPLDQQECYSVFLGDPIGCTCGNKDCDHIKAVLRS
jgi:hypothetical protein